MLFRNIIKENGSMDIYPGRDNGKSVEIKSTNDDTYTAFLHNEEVDLCLFLKEIKNKLTEDEFKKLDSLIDNYGSMKYSSGSDNEYID